MAIDDEIRAARQSLERVQSFDAESLVRRDDLGGINFSAAVASAKQVIELFQRINPSSLVLFPLDQMRQIKSQADQVYALFQSVLAFDPEASLNASGERSTLLDQIKAQPESIASNLWHHISFAVAATLDPTAVQQQMRAAMQGFTDERASALSEIRELQAQAETVLTHVRDAAAEQGVSQQAQHFKTLANEHSKDAQTWLRYSLYAAAVTLGFALLTSVTYRVPWLSPQNPIEAAQLITSKLIIFGILSYASFVCVRNFLSHKHNKVVNEHRQNSLLTYKSFVEAAPSLASREIVLTHAAASVFTPQETGYIKQEEAAGGRSVLEMITKATAGESKG